MKIVSIEPTPSPNSMKLNMDEALPAGKMYNITKQNSAEAPQYIQQLLQIDGVTGLYQVDDFIAVERHPKADWKAILPHVRAVLGDAVLGESQAVTGLEGIEAKPLTAEGDEQDSFAEIQVFVQKLKNIPMQIKLISGTVEERVGLPEQFVQAVMQAQSASSNLILERVWEEQDVRYGNMAEIGQQVAEELLAAYDDERLASLVEQAFAEDSQPEEARRKLSLTEIERSLDEEDWRVRYAALEQIELTAASLPVLKKALQDEKVSIRRLATAYLGEFDGDEALPLLYSALQDKSAAVRRTAGDAVSDIGDPAALEHMLKALHDKNKLVRWRAARFMYEVGDERAIPDLEKIVDDPEFEVSLQARIALERIRTGDEAEGTVWQQMTQRSNK